MDQQSIDIIKNHLSDGPITIKFTKSDGTEREMRCTTCVDDIPEEKLPKGDSNRKFSDEAQRVFDLDKQEWRSFRWDSLLEVTLGE